MLGVSSTEEAWWLTSVSEGADNLIESAFSILFNRANDLTFSCFTMDELKGGLISSKYLFSKVEDEVESLSYCTGRYFQNRHQNPADRAYDSLLVSEHLLKEGEKHALQFYRSVRLPARKHYVSGPGEGTGVRWRVTYEDLLLRMLSHLSHEPVLMRAFLDEQDPVQAYQERLEIEDEEVCYAVMLWSAFAFDSIWFLKHYPDLHSLLPGDLNEMRKSIETNIPVISLWVSRVVDDYARQKAVKTLYGRVYPWGGVPADACHFVLTEGTQDLLDIALVSVLGNPEGAWIGQVEGIPTDRDHRIRGKAGTANKRSWLPALQVLADLAHPLSVPLSPTVVWS